MIAAFSNCYKLSGLAKLGELKNYIQDLLENDIKVNKLFFITKLFNIYINFKNILLYFSVNL